MALAIGIGGGTSAGAARLGSGAGSGGAAGTGGGGDAAAMTGGGSGGGAGGIGMTICVQRLADGEGRLSVRASQSTTMPLATSSKIAITASSRPPVTGLGPAGAKTAIDRDMGRQAQPAAIDQFAARVLKRATPRSMSMARAS